jgi:ribonuclease E
VDNGHAEGDIETGKAGAWANGGHIAEVLSTDDVATAVERPEIKVPRQQRIWDVPSKAQDADDVVMLEGTASEATSDAPTQDAKAPAPGTERSTPAPAPRRRHEVGSSEPRIERVVVRPGEDSAAADADVQAAPQRKGWWQRKFGGE